MEDSEVVRIAKASLGSHEIRRLYRSHVEIDSEIDDLSRRWYLSPGDLEKIKRLKFLKAHGKRKLFELLEKLESEDSENDDEIEEGASIGRQY